MQKVTRAGLIPAPEKERRCKFVPTWNANWEDTKRLIQTWESKSPQDAYKMLSMPDVVVTNASDKKMKLPKLLKIDSDIKRAMGGEVKEIRI